jgi:hypothetical protein
MLIPPPDDDTDDTDGQTDTKSTADGDSDHTDSRRITGHHVPEFDVGDPHPVPRTTVGAVRNGQLLIADQRNTRAWIRTELDCPFAITNIRGQI